MANTEKIAVLKLIRELKKEVQGLKSDDANPSAGELETVFMILDDLEDEIIYNALEERVQEIENASTKLISVITEAKNKSAELDEIAKKINKVAEVLSKLVDIASKAASFI